MPFRQQNTSTNLATPSAPAPASTYQGLARIDREDSDVRVDPWAVVALALGALILWLALVVNTDLNTLTAGSAPSPETSTSEVAR